MHKPFFGSPPPLLIGSDSKEGTVFALFNLHTNSYQNVHYLKRKQENQVWDVRADSVGENEIVYIWTIGGDHWHKVAYL